MSDADNTRTDHQQPSLLAKQADRVPTLIVVGGDYMIGKVFRLVDHKMVIGRSSEANIWLDDPSVSRKHAAIEMSGGGFRLLDLKSKNGTLVNGTKTSEHLLTDGDKVQIGHHTVLKFNFRDGQDEDFQRRLYESATRDGLTNLYNRAFFTEALLKEYGWAARSATGLALLKFDVDNFKQVNAAHGHPTGDAVLLHLAQTLGKVVSAGDTMARYGGEEFVVMLKGSTFEAALAVAERARALVHNSPFSVGPARIDVTVSVGVAFTKGNALPSADALLAATDRALAQAKAGGGDRVNDGSNRGDDARPAPPVP